MDDVRDMFLRVLVITCLYLCRISIKGPASTAFSSVKKLCNTPLTVYRAILVRTLEYLSTVGTKSSIITTSNMLKSVVLIWSTSITKTDGLVPSSDFTL